MSEFKLPEGIEEFVEKWLTGSTGAKIGKRLEQRKEENSIQVIIAEPIPSKKDDIGAVNETEKPVDSECTCQACVMCTNAVEGSEPVHMKKDGVLIHIFEIGRLNETDIEMDGVFSGCKGGRNDNKYWKKR